MIKDTKSSNGTFVNGQRLSEEGCESDFVELRDNYTLTLGVDIFKEDGSTSIHIMIIFLYSSL